MLKSLHKRHSELAKSQRQLEILSNGIFQNGDLPKFKDKIAESNQFPLQAKKLEILQINVGYMCNQVCAHCHVDAGPDRKEIMTKTTIFVDLDNTIFKIVNKVNFLILLMLLLNYLHVN